MSTIKRKNKHEKVKPQRLLKHTLVKANTPRWHPLQMLEIDYPPEFKGVKEAFYAHIKSLWNIMEKNSLLTPPSEADLVKFYRKFSNTSQIEDSLQEQEGLSIDGEEDLHEFQKKQLKQLHLGQAQNNDDLYNVACHIVAITTLQQLAVGGAYNKYSINFSFITKNGLLQRAYDHFVHYRMKMCCDKEARIPGSFEAREARSSSNKNRSRLKAQTEMRRRTIPDWNSVAFLVNPEESLEGQVHPDEKLSDKGFNKKFREAILKAYPIPVQNDHSEEDLEIENEGGSIDLEAPSVNQDEEDTYFYAPGEYAYDEDEVEKENESNSEGSDYMMDEVEDV
ncbi:hypothetical protein O181_054024 [Austropuccinia psidii MF-1]|uniref:Uncharacterized protein n=1 Tax=Austropuccinia psidii MF-1 TaxID=1389203 RepID=A0A9Q3E3T2_9BASI|nr:hypothetical protein [Austropuccinia psidii MF-1]